MEIAIYSAIIFGQIHRIDQSREKRGFDDGNAVTNVHFSQAEVERLAVPVKIGIMSGVVIGPGSPALLKDA
jgi:hypothetical protein